MAVVIARRLCAQFSWSLRSRWGYRRVRPSSAMETRRDRRPDAHHDAARSRRPRAWDLWCRRRCPCAPPRPTSRHGYPLTRRRPGLRPAGPTSSPASCRQRGRVVDDGNGAISHSEGQGYGMLLAVAAGDSLTFSRLWGWTARELEKRPDGLASWRWSPTASPPRHGSQQRDRRRSADRLGPGQGGRGNGTAPNTVPRPARSPWRSGAHATFKSRFGLALKPAASGFGPTEMADGPVVNLSYWVFPAFASLADVAPEVDWAGLTRSGLEVLDAARFGPAELPSDWISIAADPKPAQKFPANFSYDAVRIPLYVVWGGLDTAKRLEPFIRLARNGAALTTVDVSTGLPGKPFYDDGYAAIIRLAACAAGPSDAGIGPGESREPALFSGGSGAAQRRRGSRQRLAMRLILAMAFWLGGDAALGRRLLDPRPAAGRRWRSGGRRWCEPSCRCDGAARHSGKTAARGRKADRRRDQARCPTFESRGSGCGARRGHGRLCGDQRCPALRPGQHRCHEGRRERLAVLRDPEGPHSRRCRDQAAHHAAPDLESAREPLRGR